MRHEPSLRKFDFLADRSSVILRLRSQLTLLLLSCAAYSVKTQRAALAANEDQINGEEPHTSVREAEEEPQQLSEKEMEKKQAPRQG